MGSLDFNLDTVPVWIQLSNVPLEMFNQKGIGYLASAVGIPLYMDKVTARRERLSFARVCVKIEADMEIPKSIDLKSLPIGELKQWVPKKDIDKVAIETIPRNQNKGKQVVVMNEDRSTGNIQPSGGFVVDSGASSSLGIAGFVNRFAILEKEDLLRNSGDDSAKGFVVIGEKDVKVQDEKSVTVLNHISIANEATSNVDEKFLQQIEAKPEVSNNEEINNSEDEKVELPIDGLVDDRARKLKASTLGFANLMKSIANEQNVQKKVMHSVRRIRSPGLVQVLLPHHLNEYFYLKCLRS
ncbi:hypothetical protein PTKIN_Ptkin10aG0044800 [Pterospermum kingtungense]